MYHDGFIKIQINFTEDVSIVTNTSAMAWTMFPWSSTSLKTERSGYAMR